MNRAPLGRALIILALGGLCALIVAVRLPFCPMAAVLGVPCPGCGLSRATLALLHGDVRQALHFHPLVFVIAPVFLWGMGSAAYDFVFGPRTRPGNRPWLSSRRVTALGSLLLVATLSMWGLRFVGYFGGPVPVLTFRAWAHSHRVSALAPRSLKR